MSVPKWKSLQQSAERARKSVDHEKAVELYNQALARPNVPWKACVDMTMRRAYCQRMLGRFSDADASLTALAEKAMQQGDDAAAVGAYAELIFVYRKTGELKRGLEVAQLALDIANRTGQPELKAEALLALGEIQHEMGKHQEGNACADQALALIEPQDTLKLIKHHFIHEYSLGIAGKYQDLVASNERAVELARSIGDHDWEGMFLNQLAIFTIDIAVKRTLLDQALNAFEAAGDHAYVQVVLTNRAAIDLDVGLYNRVIEIIPTLYKKDRLMGQDVLCVHDLSLLGGATFFKGDLSAALSYLNEGLSLARKIGSFGLEYSLLANIALCYLMLQQPAETFELLHKFDVIPYQQNDFEQVAILDLRAIGHVLSGDYSLARTEANRALLKLNKLGEEVDPLFCWYIYRALHPSETIDRKTRKMSQKAWQALELGIKSLLHPIQNMSDAGLKRGYLHRDFYRRLLILEWLEYVSSYAESAEQMTAFTTQVQKPGRLDEVFTRLLKVGMRLNAVRDPSQLPDEIVEEINELTGAERISLVLLDENGKKKLAKNLLPTIPYKVLAGQDEQEPDPDAFLIEIQPWLQEMIETRQGFIRHLNPDAGLTKQLSVLVAPLISQGKLIGVIYCDLRGCFGRFDPEDLNLLTVLANQSAVALENANWSATLEQKVDQRTEELKQSNSQLQQRTAELTIINRVQEGLVRNLDFQSIIDLVGDEIVRVFPPPKKKAKLYSVVLALYDSQTNLIRFPYVISGIGKRFNLEPRELGSSLTSQVIQSRQPLVIKNWQEAISRGAFLWDDGVADDYNQSWMGVPILVGDQVTGVIAVMDPRKDLYTSSDVRLLSTLAASLGVALENARLFDETQRLLKETEQRNAELAVINSIQQGLAAQLDIQGIFDLVGDKIRQIFDAQMVLIDTLDFEAGTVTNRYFVEKGQRYYPESRPLFKLHVLMQRTHETVVINQDALNRINELGIPLAGGPEAPRSAVFVPLLVGENVRGVISIQNNDREEAFDEASIHLLTTITNSMSVALENARLFDETQHLLKETEQRNAELAIINSVQEGLASKLDMQEIYDLVCDKVREIFASDVVALVLYDEDSGMTIIPHMFDHGQRYYPAPQPVNRKILQRLKTNEPILIGTHTELLRFMAEYGLKNIGGPTPDNSHLYMPILTGEKTMGVISIAKFSEHAFNESDVRLLRTLVNSMSVALENARLFDETQRLLKETEQRNAELAIINSVQEGLASKLDMQEIYDLVCDKVCEIFSADVVGLELFNEETGMTSYPHVFDHGARYYPPPQPTNQKVLRRLKTREPILFSTWEEAIQWMAEYGEKNTGGPTPDNSHILMPIFTGEKIMGEIAIAKLAEHAFDESDVRLLQTLVNSMSVALENARLFDETQRLLKETEQRNAELAILNSVGDAMSSQLDIKTITRLVGDKVREIFASECVVIYLYDPATNILHPPYLYDKGYIETEHSEKNDSNASTDPIHKSIVVDQKHILTGTAQEFVDIAGSGFKVWPDAEGGEGKTNSFMGVPIIVGEQVRGLVSVQSYQEHAYNESNLRLLSTLASSMGVAIENARLFQETRQRASELAILNSVGDAMASQLDISTITHLVGDKVREIFASECVLICLYDPGTHQIRAPYAYDKGYIDLDDTHAVDPEVSSNRVNATIILERKSLLFGTWQEQADAGAVAFPNAEGGEGQTNSYMGVPIVVGEQVRGLVSVQSYREHAYDESNLRLLSTLAAGMGVAIENARLFQAEQERVAELEIINSIQQGLAAELDFQAIIDLVGDKLREVFNVGDLGVNWYDEKANLVHYMYAYEHGKRISIPPTPPRPGGAYEIMMKNRLPLVKNSGYSAEEAIPGTDVGKSLVSIPIISSDRFMGDISIENFERENAFGESEVRLLTTIAASLGTALENARLFNETQRLLKETEQRNAELAILNKVGDALSKQLNVDAITKIVGDQVRDTFNAEVTTIHFYDPKNRLITTPYYYDKGYVNDLGPIPLGEGMVSIVIQKREPLVLLTVEDETEAGGILVPDATGGGGDTKSYMGVPIIVGDNVIGVVSVQSYQEHAFHQSHVSLLSTLAASMGVAIANARQFQAEQARIAELQIINSIQQGLAAELDFQAIVDLVGDKLREVFHTPDLIITWYDEKADLMHSMYVYEHDQRLTIQSSKPSTTGPFSQMRKTHQPVVWNTAEEGDVLTGGIIPGTDRSLSGVMIPIISSDRVIGIVQLENYEREFAFGESELRLLTTIAASLGSALENAHLFDETQRLVKAEQARVAELEIINSIQQGLAAELDFQAIIDLVGDKLREVFASSDMLISWYDEKNDTAHHLYLCERGERITAAPTRLSTPGSLFESFSKHRTPEVWNNKAERSDSPTIPGTTTSTSGIAIPIISSDKIIGAIQLFDIEKENAYGEAEQRLLTTVAASLGTTLENARLFEETQRLLKETEQRNAELAIINSVQAALAAELNIQGIYDAVGDKIREIFHSDNLEIRILDPQTNLLRIPYLYEHNQRITIEPQLIMDKGFAAHVLRTRETIVINENMEQEVEKYGSFVYPGTQLDKSCVMVPLIVGDQARGLVNLSNFDREHAFSDSDVRLLQTLVNSMSVALENARLFNETQRLLKETEQRAAELAILNSVGDAMARQLDVKTITHLVGDKVRDIFSSESVIIWLYDPDTNLLHPPFVYDKGYVDTDNTNVFDGDLTNPIKKAIVVDRKSLLFGTSQEMFAAGAEVYPYPDVEGGMDSTSSFMGVPIIVGERVRGVVSVQSYREHAYDESNLRLLSTLASSMGVAIENARLFQETQRLLAETEQRNSELAIINSVQAALAAELNIQGIYDAVGDKIRNIFNSNNLEIRVYDPNSNLEYFPYCYENGKRIELEPLPRIETGFSAHVARTRETLVINENMMKEIEKYGSYLMPGTQVAKSTVFVPLIVGDQVRGLVGLSDFEHEHAFSDSDVRLLQTLVNSMSVALENARLFAETQRLLEETSQRASELAIINSVSQSMSSQLQVESIVRTVGDQVRDSFHSEVVNIALYDPANNLIHLPYCFDRQYVTTEPFPYGSGLTSKVLDTKQPLILGSFEEITRDGAILTPNAPEDELMPQSYLGVPIIVGDKAIGVIDVQSYKRFVYNDSHVRLLSTLASSMGVALENARLFEETRRLLAETEQRNRELAIISRIGQALAGQLDPQGIFELVGEELQGVFDAQVVAIITYDRQEDLVHWRYVIEKGKRETVSPSKPAGFSGNILRTRQPVLISRDYAQRALEYGSKVVAGEAPKSYLGVPLIAGGEATGVITLQNIDREEAFNENDLRLLSTLALSMGVALENARLYQETQHHAVEMATLAEIGSDIASTHEMEPVLERMASKTRELMQVRDIAMYLLQPDGHTLRPIVSQGKYAEETKAQLITLGHGITGSVAQKGVAEIINYPEQDKRAIHIEGTADEVNEPECFMVAPLISRGRLIGVISVYRDRDQGLFNQLELDFLVSLARQAAIAIESARLYAETERRATEMAALAEVSREISATLELQLVLERIAGQARELLSAASSAVYLLQPDGVAIRAIVAEGDVAQEVLADEDSQLGVGIIGSIVKSGVAEWINDTGKDKRGVQIPGTKDIPEGEKLLVAPLMIQERAIGALAVWRNPDDPLFNQAELSFSIGLAQQAVVAIENARLFETAQESQRRMADIINFLPDATLVIDREGKVIAWNHAIEEMTGVKAEDILGKGNYEYALPFYGKRRPILIDTVLIHDEEVESNYSHILRHENVVVGEAIAQLKGQTTYLNATASALRNSKGETVGAIESIRDITDQKKAEQELHQAKAEAEAANQAKSAFLAMMSHEIRTPMNAIIGMSGLLMDTTLNPDQREFAETIRSSGDSLLTIINDILDFSKIEAGKMTLDEQPFDLRECIEASLDLIKVKASEKSLELAYQLESGVPPAVLGDVTRVRQVLINLLGNSVKFTDRGEIILTVSKGDKKGSLHFSVRDTGIGIAPDRVSQLFRPFTQADTSISRRYGGTGLGLALSSRLVELMGGRMWVESEGVPGKGSTFHFIIHAKPAPNWKGHPLMQGEHPQLRGKRVLVVDDNATNRRILELQTKAWGMQPWECPSPQEALDILQQGNVFDLAIIDMHMPTMSGMELASEIRKLEASHPDTPKLPLVLSTSLGGREEARESAEFAAILMKPIRQSALFDTLMTIFAAKRKPTVKTAAEHFTLDPEMAGRHPLRILLAEDNVVNQKLALRLLSQMGYRADVAANGLEVLQAVKRQPYDVILMDVQMPEMDGLEATRRLCVDVQAGIRPRIIAMTANAMQGDREMCLEAGMDDYLSKPIRVDELVAALNLAQPRSSI